MWKYVLLALGVFAFAKANSQQITATTSTTVLLDREPATKAVEKFFVHFHEQDTTAMRGQFSSGANLQSVSMRDGKQTISVSSISDFLTAIATIPADVDFKETLTGVEILESDGITSVHAHYEFLVNGNITHHGTNVFTLVWLDKTWKITQITDTRFY